MITVGVDLAASAANTGVAVLNGARVAHLVAGADDEHLLTLCAEASKIGIDCPFGWPDEFVAFVAAHQSAAVTDPRDTVESRRPLVYRATDRYWQAEGLRPLSVSADRIGHAAMRCAGLLARLTDDPDRSGNGRIVETYPAGSLKRWGQTHRGYKGSSNRPTLAALADNVRIVAGLTFADPTTENLYRTSDHAFDAVIAALTARCPLEPVPDEYREVARREGWIRLPSCSLAELASI